jgi:hypothetical protein
MGLLPQQVRSIESDPQSHPGSPHTEFGITAQLPEKAP